ncbi:MAG: T9SS C-terminal target domain-containing protein [Ignavibacteriae bacterium]|nr:MAG: T9SS C-terminal target domain-containing protein [Ignavibacteriota bacterium]
MRKILFFFFAFSFFAYSVQTSISQVNSPWKWSHPTPQGNTLRYVKVISPTEWVALGYAGTFVKTTNTGTNWFITHAVAGNVAVNQISLYNGWFFNSTTGLACGESGNIRRTTNGGVTWDSVSSGVTVLLYGMHFVDANTGFACGSSGNVIKTTNGGLAWSPLTTGVTYTCYNIFALSASNLYVATGTSGILLTSTDGGTNWIKDTTGTSTTLYDVAFKNANTGVVSGSSTNLRVTTDAGATWTSTGTGLASSTLYGINYFSASNTWYASGNSFYAFRSTNDGLTWDSVSLSGNQFYVSTYYTLDRNGTTLFTAGAFGLMNSSTNSGANWTAHNNLPYSSTLNDIWCDNMNGRVIAVGSVAPTPVFYSTNGGTTWNNTAATGVTQAMYGLKMINSLTGYATGSSGKILRTTSGGVSWDSVTYAGVNGIIYCPDFINVNTGWISGASGVVKKTTDGGTTWNTQTSGVTTTLYRIDMVDSLTGWFIGSTATLRKTTDGGTTWNAQTPNYSSTLYWINMLNANTGYLCGAGSTLRRTTNGGTNWDTVLTPVSATHYSVSFTNVNTGFVVGGTGYTIRTSNGGTSWEINNDGAATHGAVFAKGYDSAWACASSGAVMKLYNTFTGSTTWNSQVPEAYVLSQNYPNPFNPTTIIQFAIPKAGKVSLKVYDITGREVAVLLNNILLNAGTVKQEFSGTNLASGVYFYSLFVNDNKIDTKKMVLVK